MKKPIVFTILIILGITVFAQNSIHHQYMNYGDPDLYRKTFRIPDIMGFKTLKCDFHIHTIFSDGSIRPDVRVREAWIEGLDAIAITDHDFPMRPYIKADYNTPYELALPLAERLGITLIRGIEYTRDKPVGHFNFLFIADAGKYKDMDAETAIETVSNDGAFVIYNHPGWPDMNSDLFDLHKKFIAGKKIHAVEVFNSNEFYPLAVDYCNQYNLTPISATDIHGPVGMSYDLTQYRRNMNLVFATDNSPESIKEALMGGRTVAYSYGLLAGNEKYISALFKASVEIYDYKEENYRFSGKLRNNSDIDYWLESKSGKRIGIPAQSTVYISDRIDLKGEVFNLMNSYIESEKHFSFPFDFLVPKPGCTMPFVKQHTMMMDKASKIEMFSTSGDEEIRYTLDGSDPTGNSTKYTAPFTVGQSCVLKAVTFKPGAAPSSIFQQQIMLSATHQALKSKYKKNGLNYSYYEGTFQSVGQVEAKGKFIKRAVCKQPDMTLENTTENFAYIFDGFIYAPESGLYRFATWSDAGSTLYIDNIEVVNNDGLHSAKKVTQEINLEKGFHAFKLKYIEDRRIQLLKVYWGTPGKPESEIPVSSFFVE